MKTIYIKNKKYPGTSIKVSDIDYDAVIKYKWYIQLKPNGKKRVDSFNCSDGKKKELTHFIYERMKAAPMVGVHLLHANDDDFDFTRDNVIDIKESYIVKDLIVRDYKKKNMPDGNEYCAGLEANMKLRELW